MIAHDTRTEDPATAGAGDVLLPAKKRAAFCALVLATAMDVLALATGPTSSGLRASYIGMIVLYLVLLFISGRLRYGPRFEVIAVTTISAGLLFRYGVALHANPEITGSGASLFSLHAALITTYLLAFTFFDKKLAGAASTLILIASIAILTMRLAAEADLQFRLEGQPHIRTAAVHAICIALLYVLSASKDQMQQSRANASALTIVAGTDELTGIANRRSLTSSLQREIARADRSLSALSVVMIDLDHFKAVNDTHGHATGDAVLQRAAAVLRDSVRAGDTAGRWGGEEFLIIAANAPGPAAADLAERCRRQLREEPVPEAGTVTASFGVAAHEPGDSLESLVARADEALYTAKANGRDRVVLADPVPSGTPR